ncbi:MAG: hypothetical protein LBD13_03615 [Spirochaetaceae bacterium]|nr:hypothetical protein [Spirochaetaceae bacterium]
MIYGGQDSFCWIQNKFLWIQNKVDWIQQNARRSRRRKGSQHDAVGWGFGGSRRLFPYGKFAKEYAKHEAPVKKPPNSLKEACSADNSLYTNDLCGDRVGYFAGKQTYFAGKQTYFAGKQLLFAGKQTYFASKPTCFAAAFCWYNKNYRRFRASLRHYGGS